MSKLKVTLLKNIASALIALVQTNFLDSSEVFDDLSETFDT